MQDYVLYIWKICISSKYIISQLKNTFVHFIIIIVTHLNDNMSGLARQIKCEAGHLWTKLNCKLTSVPLSVKYEAPPPTQATGWTKRRHSNKQTAIWVMCGWRCRNITLPLTLTQCWVWSARITDSLSNVFKHPEEFWGGRQFHARLFWMFSFCFRRLSVRFYIF